MSRIVRLLVRPRGQGRPQYFCNAATVLRHNIVLKKELKKVYFKLFLICAWHEIDPLFAPSSHVRSMLRVFVGKRPLEAYLDQFWYLGNRKFPGSWTHFFELLVR